MANMSDLFLCQNKLTGRRTEGSKRPRWPDRDAADVKAALTFEKKLNSVKLEQLCGSFLLSDRKDRQTNGQTSKRCLYMVAENQYKKHKLNKRHKIQANQHNI